MGRRIYPVSHPLNGSIDLPGDIFCTIAGIAAATAAKGISGIWNPARTTETSTMLSGVRDIGVKVFEQEKPAFIEINSPGKNNFTKPDGFINAGSSISVFKMLMGLFAGTNIDITINAERPAVEQPVVALGTPMILSGVFVHMRSRKYPPVRIIGRSPVGIYYLITDNQENTLFPLLLFALAGSGEFRFETVEPLRGLEFVNILSMFGAQIEYDNQQFVIQAPQELTPTQIELPGDEFHGYLIAAAAALIPHSKIEFTNFKLTAAMQRFFDKLQEMGITVEVSETEQIERQPIKTAKVAIETPEELKGFTLNLYESPELRDLASLFVLLGVRAKGTTIITGTETLNELELDRIKRLLGNLSNHGIDFEEIDGGYKLNGVQQISGGDFFTHGDPWLTALLVLAGLVAREPTTLDDTTALDGFYPRFFPILAHIGGLARPKKKRRPTGNIRKRR